MSVLGGTENESGIFDRAATTRGRKGEAAMPTGIAEHPRTPIVPTHGEQGHPEGDSLDVVTRVRDGRGGNEHARHRAQQPEFLGEPAWVQVVFDGFTPSTAFIGGAGINMGEDAPDDLHIVSNQRLGWGAHTCQYHTMIVTRQ